MEDDHLFTDGTIGNVSPKGWYASEILDLPSSFSSRKEYPPSVANNLFNSAMTIRMNVTGSALLLNAADITGDMRLFGD